MSSHIQTIKNYLLNLDFDITNEDDNEGILVVQKERYGIKNLVIGIAPPILIMEQYIFKLQTPSIDVYQSLLKKNRDIIHGAFVLDELGDKVIFRDTLQIEDLSIGEFEASLNSLSLLLSEYSEQIITFSKY